MSWKRVLLLCEDRAHLDFLRDLCTQYQWRIAFEHVAPKGQGAASAWVLQQFPARLRELRTMPSELGLLVAIDGDNLGRTERLNAMARICAEQEISERTEADPTAILVPTWSIDTWALFFYKNIVVPENESAKSKTSRFFQAPHPGFMAPSVPVEDAPRMWKPAPRKSLIDGFLGQQEDPQLMSLSSSRKDLERWLK